MGSTIYTVKQGDTLAAIAKTYNTTVQAIQQLNSDTIKDINRIYPNQKITIPSTVIVSEANKVDSINETFGNNPQADKQGCPTNQKIAIFPVRYAIDEAPKERGATAKHPIPSSWGATGLPEIKTRSYCMRQLRDGWLYVWDGEKFDEYNLKGSDFTHTNRHDKTLPFQYFMLENTEVMAGEKGTKKYLEYTADKTYHIAYAQERWTENLYQKMLDNKEDQRNSWMRELDLTKLCQGIQPHTQLISEVANHVADIYQDVIDSNDDFKTTTVHYSEPLNPELEVEVKPPLLSSTIIGSVPEKESAFFVALDDMIGLVNDLSFQAAGRNLEFASFNKNYEHKLFMAGVVEQLCSTNLADEDYPKSATTQIKKRKYINELEETFEQIQDVAERKYSSTNPLDRPWNEEYFYTEAARAAWNGKYHACALMLDPMPLALEFRKKYSISEDWYIGKYKAWYGNKKSRRQVKYQEAITFLDKRDDYDSLQQHTETAVKDLTTCLEYIGNEPNKIFLDPIEKSQCELLIVNFTTAQEQICTASEAGKNWHAKDLIDKKTLISLISYNFSIEWATKFESMVDYYLKHGKLEKNEPDYDTSTLISRLLAGGNLANASESGIGALGKLYQSYFVGSGSSTGGTNNIPTGAPTTIPPTSSIPPISPTPPIISAPSNSPYPTAPIGQSVPASTPSPAMVMQNRVARAITFERIIQTNLFKNMEQELQQVFLVLEETLGGSKNALDYWQKSIFYRTIVMNYAILKDHRFYLISAKIAHAVLMRGKVELTPIIYADPYFEENYARWEQDKIALENERKPIANEVKKRESYRGRGKNWNRKLNDYRGQLADIDDKITALKEIEPVELRTTGYLVDNHTIIVNEHITDVKLRYLTIEGFDLPTLTLQKWLGLKGSKIYQSARLSNKPLRQALPPVPPPAKLPIPAVNRAGNVATSQVNLQASVGLLGIILIGLNIANCANTLYQANSKTHITVNDIATIASAHAYLGSLLFSFKMGLWENIKNTGIQVTKYTRTGPTTTTEKLINLAPKEWIRGGPNFVATAQEFVAYAKGFAILGFIASGIETIQLAFKLSTGGTTSKGETVASSFKLASTAAMTLIAGYQVYALFTYASMTSAFGPWMMAATLVAATIYFVANYYETYFHIEGFDQWLQYCCWGNNPKWDDSEEGRKTELRSLQELLLQPTVYAVPQIDDDTGRLCEHKIYIIFPPQLINTKLTLKCLLTENRWFSSTGRGLGDGYGSDDYVFIYQEIIDNGGLLEYTTAINEIQTAIKQLNQNQQPEQMITAPQAKQQPNIDLVPVVWETVCMYDDSIRDKRAQNLELEIIYPQTILEARPDRKGYRFKLADIDRFNVAVGTLTFNNTDPREFTKNDLTIDTDMAARYGTIYLTETNA